MVTSESKDDGKRTRIECRLPQSQRQEKTSESEHGGNEEDMNQIEKCYAVDKANEQQKLQE